MGTWASGSADPLPRLVAKSASVSGDGPPDTNARPPAPRDPHGIRESVDPERSGQTGCATPGSSASIATATRSIPWTNQVIKTPLKISTRKTASSAAPLIRTTTSGSHRPNVRLTRHAKLRTARPSMISPVATTAATRGTAANAGSTPGISNNRRRSDCQRALSTVSVTTATTPPTARAIRPLRRVRSDQSGRTPERLATHPSSTAPAYPRTTVRPENAACTSQCRGINDGSSEIQNPMIPPASPMDENEHQKREAQARGPSPRSGTSPFDAGPAFRSRYAHWSAETASARSATSSSGQLTQPADAGHHAPKRQTAGTVAGIS